MTRLPEARGHRRSIGLAVGALWLIVISTGFATLSLFMIGRPIARAALVGALLIGATLSAIAIKTIRAVLRLAGPLPPRTPEERRVVQWFGVIVGAEVIVIMVVNTVCVVIKHPELIVAFDLAIVGLHFVPLAWLFRVPRYHLTALFFCGIAVLTPLSIPATAHVGDTLAWYVVPSLGCAAVAWLTAVASFREIWQLMSVGDFQN